MRIYDGKFDQPMPVQATRIKYPYTDFRPFVIYEQDFVVLATAYVAGTLGQKHPTYTDAILAEEVNFQPVGGGLLKFTRIFATVPDSMHELPILTSYTYPEHRYTFQQQYPDGTLIDIGKQTIRQPFTRRVAGRQVYTYHSTAEATPTSNTFSVNDRAYYQGYISTVQEIDEVTGNVTVTYRNRSYDLQTATVSPFMLVRVGQSNSELVNFRDLPISPQFKIEKTKITWRRADAALTSRMTNAEAYAALVAANQTIVQEPETTQVQYVDQFTDPTIDEYKQLGALQIGETEIEQVVGVVYRLGNVYVPAL